MARKGENIYKRKDGRWEGRYIKYKTAGEKTKYGYVYARTYREAKDKLAYMSQLKKQNDKLANYDKDILIEDAAEDWIENIRPKVKASTIAKYQNLLHSYILPALGPVYLRNITQMQIESFCNHLLRSGGQKGNGLSPKTVSDTLSLIRSIMRYASYSRQLSFSDFNSISFKKNPKPIRVLTRKEQETLCHYLYQNPNNKNIGVLLCLYTGLRVGEICALKWEDISFHDKTVYVHQTMQRLQTNQHSQNKTAVVISAPKSSCSIRTIPLPDDLTEILSEACGGRTGFVLTGDENQYVEPRIMQNHLKRILKENSIESINYHTLRHTFATRCIEIGFDVKSLSEILGHANVSITMNKYVHPSMELKRENMQRLSSCIYRHAKTSSFEKNRQNKGSGPDES